jgi:hypothetical protein
MICRSFFLMEGTYANDKSIDKKTAQSASEEEEIAGADELSATPRGLFAGENNDSEEAELRIA